MSAADKMKTALETMQARSAVYGQGHAGHVAHARVIMTLFPEGLHLNSEEEHARWLLFNMILTKVCRYAANFHQGGHQDSIHDAGVYAFLLEDYDDRVNNGK